MSRYQLGVTVGIAVRLIIAVLLIGLAPVALFWAFLAACIWWHIKGKQQSKAASKR